MAAQVQIVRIHPVASLCDDPEVPSSLARCRCTLSRDHPLGRLSEAASWAARRPSSPASMPRRRAPPAEDRPRPACRPVVPAATDQRCSRRARRARRCRATREPVRERAACDAAAPAAEAPTPLRASVPCVVRRAHRALWMRASRGAGAIGSRAWQSEPDRRRQLRTRSPQPLLRIGAGLVSVQALRLGCGALYLEASVPPPQHPSTQRRHQRNRGTRQVRR